MGGRWVDILTKGGSMKVQPIGRRVLVERLEPEEVKVVK